MKKEFRAALAWMRKAQTASLFVPGLYICIDIQYTPGNDYVDKNGRNHAYSCGISVHGKGDGEIRTAEYTAWGGMSEFYRGKKGVIELLGRYGVKIK